MRYGVIVSQPKLVAAASSVEVAEKDITIQTVTEEGDIQNLIQLDLAMSLLVRRCRSQRLCLAALAS